MITRTLSQTIKEFYTKGLLDEEFVMKSTQDTFGGDCYKATQKEDTQSHIDFWWNSPKKGLIGIDVKGLKKNKRSDKDFDDTIQWLELLNVQGNDGWLKGKAEYIAFRTKNSIIYVNREKLRKFAEEKIANKTVVRSTPKDFYIPYQRWGRQDLILKCPTSDITKLSDFAITI